MATRVVRLLEAPCALAALAVLVAGAVPELVPAFVTCSGAQCRTCATLPLHSTIIGKVFMITPCITTDFQSTDMTVHFAGYVNSTKVLESEISGEIPHRVCYSPAESLAVCLVFSHINSVGNSMQVCATLDGMVVNTPARVRSKLGCFLADTLTSSVQHRVKPRPRRLPQ